jgi:membrane protease YdiL (CAAX protease family)
MSDLPPDDVPELPPAPELPPDPIPEPAPPPDVAPLPPQPRPPHFGAGKAFASFALMFGAQFFTGLLVIVVAVIVAVAAGENVSGPQFMNKVMRTWDVPLIVGSALVTALTAWVCARIWAWDLVRDRTETGLGLRRVASKWIGIAAATGITVALCYFAVASWLVPFDPKTPLGPLAQFASGSPLARITFALIALIYAPLVEEFLFRGLLFKGFSTSWGVPAGGAVVTVLFVLLHLFETINYWPATVAILALSLTTLTLRIRSGSLLPSMTLHFAYNAVVVAGVYAG